MRLLEGTFAHTMKEIELRDRRISRLEDYLERSEKRNKLLRDQLELAEGHYGDPHYLRVPVADHCDHGQGPRPVDKPPIVISFRACPTLTSFLPNPSNVIGMLQCKQSGAGSSPLTEREVPQEPIRHLHTQTSAHTVGEASPSTLSARNPGFASHPRNRDPLHGADSGQSTQSTPTGNISGDGANLRAEAMGESLPVTHLLTLDSPQDDWTRRFKRRASILKRGLRALFPAVTNLCDGGKVLCGEQGGYSTDPGRHQERLQ